MSGLKRGIVGLGVIAGLLCGMARAQDEKAWSPTDGNNWNVADNWDPPGVPTSTDVAVFDGDVNSANCTIDVNAVAAGILITNAYAGTITQEAGNTVTIGASGYEQHSGTFEGGSDDFTTRVFTLAGGVFTAPSGTMVVRGSNANMTVFSIASGTTFHHNNGTLRFDRLSWAVWQNRAHTVHLDEVLELNHLFYDSSPTGTNIGTVRYTLAGTAAEIVVKGDFSMYRTGDLSGWVFANAGTIEVQGNIISGIGARGGSSLIKLAVPGDQTYEGISGWRFPVVEIDKETGSVLPAEGTVGVGWDGFHIVQGVFTAPSGTMTVRGPNANSTVFSTAFGTTFHHNKGTLLFDRETWEIWRSRPHTIHLDEILELHHLFYTSSPGGNNTGPVLYTLAGTAAEIVVEGDFSMYRTGDQTGNVAADSGVIKVQGNIHVGTSANGGTSQIQIIGAGDQIVSHHNRREFWRYSVVGDAWAVQKRLPFEPREGSALVWAGGDRLFALRGNNSNAFWRYSMTDNEWTATVSAPATVRDGGALVWTNGDHIYALRGNNNTAFWRYSIAGDAWASMAAVPANVQQGGALAWTGDDHIYALRGNNQKSFYRYSVSGDEWTSMADTPENVNHGGALVWTGGDHLYAFRGVSDSFWRYSISGDSWTTMTDAPAAVREGGALVWTGDDSILASRGNGASDFWSFSIAEDEWSALAEAPGNFDSGGALTWTGDWLYAIPGYQSSAVPPTGVWTVDKPGGKVILATDLYLAGSGQSMEWTKGALDLADRLLSVNQHVNIGSGATILSLTVADAVTAGRLAAGGTVSGIDNVELEVAVSATAAETEGQTYTILSNNTAESGVGTEFATETWLDGWNGDVLYTENDGKDVTLSNLRYGAPGTLLIVR